MSAPGMSQSSTLRTFDEDNKAYVDSVIRAVNKYGKASKDACLAMYKHHNMDKLLGGPSNASFYFNLFKLDGDRLDQNFELKHPSEIGDDSMREVIRQFMLLNYRLTLLSQGNKKALDEFTEDRENEICNDT